MFVDPSSFSAPQLVQYKNTPALSPPTGIIPDLAAHNEKADLYIVICSILLGIVYLFLLLRIYAKVWINCSPGWDDCKECSFKSESWLIVVVAAILATVCSQCREAWPI